MAEGARRSGRSAGDCALSVPVFAITGRDAEERAHFVSFAEWDSIDALLAWRRLPEFAARMGACRALCDDIRGSNYSRAVQVP